MSLKDPSIAEAELKMLDEHSVHFLRAIKRHYTRDTAVDVMDVLAPILGKDWKGRVIFHMLNDSYLAVSSFRITVDNSQNYKKINSIKLIRRLTGQGLVEAKNIVEASEKNWMIVNLSKPKETLSSDWEREIHDAVQELRESGMKVELV